MEFKYTNVALALSAALLVGCGSDSSSGGGTTPADPEYVTDLSAEEIAELEAACVTEEAIAAIELTLDGGDQTQDDVDALVAEAIAASEGCEEEANLYAAITDTSAVDADGNSGLLKYDIVGDTTNGVDAVMTTGAVSVDVLYPVGQDQDFSIGLYDSANSTGDMVADVVLKSNGRIVIRQNGSTSTSSGAIEYSGAHTPGDTNTYVITWDTSTQQFTLYVNGTELHSGDFNNTSATGVQYFGTKLSSNLKVAAKTSTVDNIAIYSDVAMTTSVFTDDFEGYIVDEALDGSGDPYLAESTQAVVAGTESDDDGDGDDVIVPTSDYEWDFSATDGSDKVNGDKDLTMSKASDNPRTLVAGADGSADSAVHIEQSTTSGSYGYYYTTMVGTTDPLAATDGVISMEIVFSIDDVDAIAGTGNDLQLLENTDSNQGWKVIVSKSSSKPQFKIYNGTGSTTVSGLSALASDTYYHLAATYDGTTAAIYIDGVLQNSAEITDYVANTKDGDKVYIGGGSNSSQKNLEGAIDSAAFWIDTLTAEEVAARAAEFGFTAE